VDGRLHRRNKAAFSNFSGVGWTGLIGKLESQLSNCQTTFSVSYHYIVLSQISAITVKYHLLKKKNNKIKKYQKKKQKQPLFLSWQSKF